MSKLWSQGDTDSNCTSTINSGCICLESENPSCSSYLASLATGSGLVGQTHLARLLQTHHPHTLAGGDLPRFIGRYVVVATLV